MNVRPGTGCCANADRVPEVSSAGGVLHPFRALRYAPHVVPDLGVVLGPPDDLRSHEQARDLVRLHPYHSIWLELPDADDQQFTEARVRFLQWQAAGVLVPDDHPALYLYAHHYRRRGKTYRRLGVFGLISLVDPAGQPSLLPHEGVIPRVVARRLALRQSLAADVSAIYVIAQAEGRLLAALERVSASLEPLVDTRDPAGERHQLWAVSEPEAIQLIERALAGASRVIADGHHRYAAALADWHAQSGDAQRVAASRFVLVQVSDAADPGIQLRPIHRVLPALSADRLDAALAMLRQHFEVIPLGTLRPLTAERLQHALVAAQEVPGVVFVVAAAAAERLYALYQPQPVALPHELEVERCERLVVEPLRTALGVPGEAVVYEPELDVVVQRLASDPTAVAILLRPTTLDVVLARAQVGHLLPPKSTSFFPKVPLGLLFRPLT